MKNDKKIRRYLDGELIGEELERFENELKNSPVLKKEVEAYANTLDQFKKIENVGAKETYFTGILPRFKVSIAERSQGKVKLSFAFGSAAFVMIVFLVFLVINNNKDIIDNEQITLQQFNSEELNSYLCESSIDNTVSVLSENIPEEYDSLLNSIVVSELDINDSAGGYLADITESEFDNLLDELSEEEVNGIYNNVIDKEFY